MTPILCANCGQPMKRGEYRRQRGTTPAHQGQYVQVHRSANNCQAAKDLERFDRITAEREGVKP